MQALLEREKKRYQRKGKYLYVSIFLLISTIYFTPIFAQFIWNQFFAGKIENTNRFYIITLSLCHTLAALLNLLFYLPMYKFGWCEQWRADKNVKWPWQQEDWPQQLRETLKTVIFYHVLVFPIVLFVDTKIGIAFRMDNDSLPSTFEMFSQILVAILFEDFMFFMSHKALHIPILYKLIHKKHHEYYQPFSIAAEYANIGEYLFGNVIPASAGFKVLRGRAHILTVFVWVFVRLWYTAEAHSGYELPFSPRGCLPMSGSCEFHNFHHSKNVGTYGSFFTFWDYIFGSDISFNKWRETKYEKIEQEKLKKS